MAVLALAMGEASAACDAAKPGGLPNHFIVLLDGSGSMKTDYKNTWWRPGFDRLSPIEKSARIDKVVRKALEALPEGFPCFSQDDRFSFAFFSLDWENPSYKLENLFIVPEGLLLRTGLPAPGSSWPGTGNWSPREPFHGHSTFQDSPWAIFPYLGEKIVDGPHPSPVGRVILVRITDGKSEMVDIKGDEYTRICDAAALPRNRKTGAGDPKDRGIYEMQTKPTQHGLDLGARSQSCTLAFSDYGMQCGDAAQPILKKGNDPKSKKDQKDQKGQGLLVAYLEAKPRNPPLETLASLSSNAPALRREAQGGVVYWRGGAEKAALLGWASDDGALAAAPQRQVGFFLKTPEGDVKVEDCTLPEQAGPDKTYPIDCGEGQSLPALDAATVEKYQAGGVLKAYYQTAYRVRFQGQPPAYPLEWELRRDIPLELAATPGRDEQYHPSLWPGVFSHSLNTVSDAELLAAAGGGTLKASELAEKKNGNPEDNASNLAQQGLAALLLLGLGWFGWPFGRDRQWRVMAPAKAARYDIDFNQPPGKQLPVQIGTVALERTRPPLGLGWLWQKTALRLAIPKDEIRFHGPAADDRLAWQDGLLGISAAGQGEHEDRHAVGGSRYPLMFDAGKVADLETQAADPQAIDGSLSFALQSQPFPAGGVPALDLRLAPERAKFDFKQELLCPARPDNAGRQAMVSNYAKGKPLPLARYTLENDVKHAFSQPARGRWSLAPRALDGKAGPPEGAFYLLDTNTSVNGQAVDYSLRKGQTREILLVADLKKLGNPKPGEPREYEIKLLDDSGKTVAEHRFALERSDQRAFVEMALLDHAGNTLQAYDELRHPAGSLPVIDLSGNRQDISEDVPGRRVLFGLRLANRCDDGAGYADWRVSLDDPAGTGILNGDGVYCPLDAFVVADGQSGTLPDDPDADKRETALTVELDPRGPQFDRREPSLDLPLRVEFDKYEDGKAGAKKTLSWQITVRLALRHVPARRVLAIDFGTSAIAAVYDTDETLQVLPLARQVKSEGSTLSQHFEYPNPYFLSADASLASALGQPMRPNDSKFLDLPADANAAFKDAKTIIPSLKMLLVRNYLNLPINPRKYPYIDNKGTIENRVDQRPPLDEVLHGVFEQLRDTYINPSLGGLSPYTYLVATHPNTYTEVERRRFRKILQEIFAGQSAFHQLYEDNIHLLGESDAVLNYYLLHAASYHAANNSKLLEKETVFIWDIGAGTLDMTLATVERERQSDGGLAPKRIIIHDRYGVEAAGNLLTECIVRDLDQYLYQNIGDAYVLPLVKHDELPPRQTKTDEELFHAMAPLRTQIEQYKRALGAGKVTTATIQLAGSEYSRQYGSPISWQDTHLTDYKQLSDIKVAVGGNVDWIPNSNGEFISAFVQRVAESEVKMFLENAKDKKGTPIASIDTVIISGRTSLWPGLLERLRQTLPDVGAWIPLTQIGNHTQDGSRTLKNAVVSGAVFSQTRWKDIEREAPAIFGRYAIRYERNGKDDWHCVDLPESGEKELDMPNARICQVGISHAGRFKVEFEFPLNSVTAQKDSRLWLKMSPNKDKEKGGFRCSIKNAAGSEIIVTEETAGTMKPQRDIEVWPLTTFQLPFLEAGRIAPANKVL